MQFQLVLFLLPTVLAAPSVDPNVLSPLEQASGLESRGSSLAKRGEVKTFQGPASKFPPESSWISFEEMWSGVEASLNSINGAENTGFLKEAIVSVAAESGVIDQRAILGVVLQESSGNVKVGSTTSPDGTVGNPGLMQSHNGVSYNANDPKGSILQMIKDGTLGTSSGDGLKQCYEKYENNIYNAFRCYNSGSVDLSNLNNAFGATASYVQDLANRLLGNPPN